MRVINVIKRNKIIFGVLLALTIFRIMIAAKVPLQLQADAMYDDFLFVKYAKSLMTFDWLGNFGYLTLAKGISFSLFLVFNYLIGIPYSISLVFIFIFSIVLFIYTIRKIISNKWFLSFLYIFLLYTPVMLHGENVQKVYRGGLLISVSLIVISCIIGLYITINNKNKNRLFYSVLLCISLPFFWYLKEDSIWILPFLSMALLLTLIKIIKSKELVKKKLVISFLPVLVLVITSLGYKTINYIKYKEFAVTDRNGTYYKEVISDLIQIDGKNRNKDYWLTRDMLDKAYENSETLSSLREAMNRRYEIWADDNGEIHGDIIFWVIKEAANDIGVYSNTGKETNEFYKKIYNELEEAYSNNKLKKNNDIYISKVVKGITFDELPEYFHFLIESKNALITHSQFDLGLYPSTGDKDSLAFFKEITMAKTVDKDINQNIYKLDNYFIKICKLIANIYGKLGYILYYTTIVSLIIMTVKYIHNLIKKKKDELFSSVYLITIGLFLTCFVQLFGTTYFGRFLSIRKMYDYSSIIYPLFQIVEAICIYLIVKNIKKIKSMI